MEKLQFVMVLVNLLLLLREDCLPDHVLLEIGLIRLIDRPDLIQVSLDKILIFLLPKLKFIQLFKEFLPFVFRLLQNVFNLIFGILLEISDGFSAAESLILVLFGSLLPLLLFEREDHFELYV